MKIIQTSMLLFLISLSATAQRADVKGPKAKNLKVHENPELFDGKVVTQEEPTKLKGPARKNAKVSKATSRKADVSVEAQPQTKKGPKAKNKKVWQQ